MKNIFSMSADEIDKWADDVLDRYFPIASACSCVLAGMYFVGHVVYALIIGAI